MQNKELQTYLDRINWNQERFTPDRLEIMLEASCLRFLGGLTDLDFVLGLSEEICKNYLDTMTHPLHYATAILHDLAEELSTNTILPTDTVTIEKNINSVQKILTKK